MRLIAFLRLSLPSEQAARLTVGSVAAFCRMWLSTAIPIKRPLSAVDQFTERRASNLRIARSGLCRDGYRCAPPILQALLAALALLCASNVNAFDLDQLSAQLAKPALVRGPFVQEKHLRALPQPLTSKGQFVLSGAHGLLWMLQSPVPQDYRINAQGIARRGPQGWQWQSGQDVAAQQSRLFLAVLKGDHSGLARDFDLHLQGSAAAWQLQLLPRSLLLKQIFSSIQIEGGALVERIELREVQGDSTLLLMPDSQPADELTEQEQRDFAA